MMTPAMPAVTAPLSGTRSSNSWWRTPSSRSATQNNVNVLRTALFQMQDQTHAVEQERISMRRVQKI